MGKSLKYVKDFDFNAKPCNYSCGGSAKKYAVGGNVATDAAQAPRGKAMGRVRQQIERNDMPRGPRAANQMQAGRQPQRDMSQPRIKPAPVTPPVAGAPTPPNAALNRLADVANPALAAATPAFKKGGAAKAKSTKMGKVMSEFKSGELRSGSKKGPVVKNRKQAIAIAMSEAGKSKNKA